jgi:Tfp pilus assembly protein PilF
LINVDVEPRVAGDQRSIFTRVIPVHQLPPGKYLLRAIVSVNNRSVKTLLRGFEVAAPKVLMTSAEGLGATSTDAELFLPVDDASMNPEFEKELATSPDTLALFKERTPAETREAFDQGVTFLASGDYPKAEASFKRAIQPEVDSTSALAYLAVTFASAGRGIQAASAFQTALVDGEEIPQIYDWLSTTLMRNHDYGEARSILEEALVNGRPTCASSGRWRCCMRRSGRGREAVRTLERYLELKSDDATAYYYAVQWFYTVHSQGVVVHNRAQDVQLAKDYATGLRKVRAARSCRW